MRRKEFMAVYHPSRFLQVMLQILVIIALFDIGFSEVESQEKEATSANPSSTMSTTTMPLPAIRIDKSSPDLKYGSNDENSINFVLYPPAKDDCYYNAAKKEVLKPSFDLSLPGYGTLVIRWEFTGSVYELRIYEKVNSEKVATSVSLELGEYTASHGVLKEGENKMIKISIPRRKGDKNEIMFTSRVKRLRVHDNNFDYALDIDNNDICDNDTWNFDGIVLLLVLLVVGLLLYFLWWRKRKTVKEEENKPPRPPGISPETMKKLLAMKPKVFPLTEKQKQIKAGAMAEEDDYPTEVRDYSGFGPVQSTGSDEITKSKSTQPNSSKTVSEKRSSAKL